MKKILSLTIVALTASMTLTISGCGGATVKPTPKKALVLKIQPPRGTLPTGKKAYYEDTKGKCAKGQVVEVTGGSSSVGRKYRCVNRP